MTLAEQLAASVNEARQRDEIAVDLTVHGLITEVELMCQQARNVFLRPLVEANVDRVADAALKLRALADELTGARP